MKNPTRFGKWLFVSLLCNGLLAILLAIVHGYSRLDQHQAALNAEALEVRVEIAQLRAQKRAGETLADDGPDWGAFPVERLMSPRGKNTSRRKRHRSRWCLQITPKKKERSYQTYRENRGQRIPVRYCSMA